MSTSRREFLGASLAAAGGLALSGRGLHAGAMPTALPAVAPLANPKPMKILILGGTGFIGPHQVRYAQYRGHEVTLFNRGRTAADMFPELETLIGDRDGQLEALRGREWDACIDNSGYVPRHVRDSAELLEGKIGRYLFTSTGSVYDFDQDELTEDSTLLTLDDPTSEDVNRYYGPLKVLCEQAVEKVYGHQGTVLRLHVVAGPGDPTDRFTRWPVRIDQGGEVLAPGDRDNPVQFIDVRDLVEFMMHCLEWDVGGVYNTAGPALTPTGMAQFLYGIRAITSSPVSFTWVDDAFLREREYRVPLWWSQNNSPIRGIGRVRAHKAVAAGLTFRPLAVTALDTLDWYNTLDDERKAAFHAGFEQEAETLAAWKARG